MARSKINRKFIKFLRSPFFPATASGFVAPGLGQIINKEFGKGFLLMFSSLGSLFYFSKILTERLELILPGKPEEWQKNQETLRQAVMGLVEGNPGMFLTFHLLLLTVWLFGIIDAYISAKNKTLRNAKA